MRASVGGSGVILRFDERDKPTLESGGTIESKFADYLKPTIKFHVCDVVEKNEEESFLTEPGFKVHSSPKGPPEQRTSYEMWISRENALRLLEEEYWATRSVIDRIDMTYWDSNSN